MNVTLCLIMHDVFTVTWLQVENVLMDDSGTYVLCDFGSATPRFLNPQKQSIKDIEEELQRLAAISFYCLLAMQLSLNVSRDQFGSVTLW